MGIKEFRPTTPGIRGMTVMDFSDLTKKKPEKGLLSNHNKCGGRNCYGRITTRHRGGGSRRHYRMIDFNRDKRGIPATVAALEYDPNRTANIALLNYADGEKRYILAPFDLKVNDKLLSAQDAEIKIGNALPLKNIPLGTTIHNVELRPGGGAKIARSAGAAIQLMAKEGEYAHVKMPSGEVRMIHLDCWATIGQIGNLEHSNISIGKAGRMRWMGRRSCVRGTAMNPVDHPHGGGEGKTKGGRHPVSPTGVPTKGYKTRKRVDTNKYILKRKRG